MKRSALALLAPFLVASGCAVQDRQPAFSLDEPPNYLTPDLYSGLTSPSANPSDAVREGRYRLVRTSPTPDQQDLLSQIVVVAVPTRFEPTVGDAIRHSLARTGFSLCPASEQNAVLYSRDLPASHFSIGPMRLRDALQVLGGPAWRVEVDEVSRTVCYRLRDGYNTPDIVVVGEV